MATTTQTTTAPTAEQLESLKIERTMMKRNGVWLRLVEAHGGRWFVPCDAPTRTYWDGRRWRNANNHRFCKTPYHMVAIDVPTEIDDELFDRGRRWLVGIVATSGAFLAACMTAACM